jgi:hypothetical protein
MISDPVALFPWSILYRREDRHPGIVTVLEAARGLGRDEGWHTVPVGAWLPEPERSRLGR